MRGPQALVAVVLTLATVLTGTASATPSTAVAPPLSIRVSGNHFVDGAGHTVRLLGADHPSFEYACVDGYGYDDGLMDAADAAAVASWHADAVRIPLNEDCWLGIDGQPNSDEGADPPLTVAGYRSAVEAYVRDLNARGIYAILDLHWTAPGSVVADGQRAMPDDHSAAFWTSVATQFKTDRAVVFDAFNEPFSPAETNDPAHPVSWGCWRDGGCAVPATNDGQTPDGTVYTAVGMQTLVDAIRATGATQPILLGGLDYANDLSGWLSHEPSDPAHQLAASFHNYQGQTCDDPACWTSTVAPVARKVPVVTGEFDQDVCASSTFDTDYMAWADAHGVSYLAWGWWVLSQAEIDSMGCSAFYLISDAGGTPASANGTALHRHLAELATPQRLLSLTAVVKHRAARFTLAAATSATGTLSARTTAGYGKPRHRKRLSLGSTKLTLIAGRKATVGLHLSSAVRRLLGSGHVVKVTVTVSLKPGYVVRRVVKLR